MHGREKVTEKRTEERMNGTEQQKTTRHADNGKKEKERGEGRAEKERKSIHREHR